MIWKAQLWIIFSFYWQCLSHRKDLEIYLICIRIQHIIFIPDIYCLYLKQKNMRSRISGLNFEGEKKRPRKTFVFFSHLMERTFYLFLLLLLFSCLFTKTDEKIHTRLEICKLGDHNWYLCSHKDQVYRKSDLQAEEVTFYLIKVNMLTSLYQKVM